jgi:hypothetical protein
MKLFRTPMLLASVALMLGPKVFAQGELTVDIYSGFDINNGPSGFPYTGYVGHYYTSDLDLNFGDPFGLTQFAAVVTGVEWVSTTGLYTTGLYSNRPDNFSFGNYGAALDGNWEIGEWANEMVLDAGLNPFEIDFISTPELDGGPGNELSFFGFSPWGGDPSVADATDALMPVPDSTSTMVMLGSALFGLSGLRRRFAVQRVHRTII